MTQRKRKPAKKRKPTTASRAPNPRRTPAATRPPAPTPPDEYEAPDFSHFWTGLLKAVGTKPQGQSTIRGVSGIAHTVVAAGVDDHDHRLVLVSNELDARAAAMAQADIQAALTDTKVIVARPILVNLAEMAEAVSTALGKPALDLQSLQRAGQPKTGADAQQAVEPYARQLGEIATRWIRNAQGVQSFSVAIGLTQALRQLSSVELRPTEIGLERLAESPPAQDDRDLGICAVPMFAFTEAEMELIHSGSDLDAISEALRRHDVFQYFYPPADYLALGLIDRTAAGEVDLTEQLQSAPGLGHPYGQMEILPADTDLGEIIDALRDRDLVVEGEVGFDLTTEGASQRAMVKFKPREGLLSKIINRFTVNIDLKSIFKM